MNESIKQLLEAPIAERVKIMGRVIIHRTQLSTGELVKIKEEKKYGPVPEKGEICELEIGGQILARGRIVKKRGGFYFKVIDSVLDNQGGTA